MRSLVGLELEAVREAMAEFISGTTLTAAQLNFINLIVEHLTRNGVMTIGQLYESPFNSVAPTGPETLFPEERLEALESAFNQLTAATRAG